MTVSPEVLVINYEGGSGFYYPSLPSSWHILVPVVVVAWSRSYSSVAVEHAYNDNANIVFFINDGERKTAYC